MCGDSFGVLCYFFPILIPLTLLLSKKVTQKMTHLQSHLRKRKERAKEQEKKGEVKRMATGQMTYNNLANNFLVSTSPHSFHKPVPIGAETHNHYSAPTCLLVFTAKREQ